MKKYILSIDQGTTSSRCIIFDTLGNIVSSSNKEFTQIYPKPSYVEHDPFEIYSSTYQSIVEAILKENINIDDILSVGITNQRETALVWDKNTGKPIYNAICWQCRRTVDIIRAIDDDTKEYIFDNTGLTLDAYFSASKIKWILDNVEGAREKANNNELLCGTVDTWLIWKFTNGKSFYTDYTNASRTMLFNIKTLEWDERLLKYFDIPRCMLPEVKSSNYNYGNAIIMNKEFPILAVCGDQQSALFGQNCFEIGDVKNTYGTGCFMLMNVGKEFVKSKNNLLTTIGISINDEIIYALEGSVFNCGSIVKWLRDELKFIDKASDSEYCATQVEDSNGVFVVPAFTGLGAPYWDMYARATIFGLTRGANRNHIIRAALESICYSVNDVLVSMKEDSGIDFNVLRVDGGASNNNFIMQYQSDVSNVIVERPKIMETTSLGVYFIQCLSLGIFKDLNEIKEIWKLDRKYTKKLNDEYINNKLKFWKKAIERSLEWEK
jgi:glycerol kinase